MHIPQIRHVTTYHADMRRKSANMTFMAFRNLKGGEKQRGWVVSGYAGNDSHKIFTSYEKAQEFSNKNVTLN